MSCYATALHILLQVGQDLENLIRRITMALKVRKTNVTASNVSGRREKEKGSSVGGSSRGGSGEGWSLPEAVRPALLLMNAFWVLDYQMNWTSPVSVCGVHECGVERSISQGPTYVQVRVWEGVRDLGGGGRERKGRKDDRLATGCHEAIAVAKSSLSHENCPQNCFTQGSWPTLRTP